MDANEAHSTKCALLPRSLETRARRERDRPAAACLDQCLYSLEATFQQRWKPRSRRCSCAKLQLWKLENYYPKTIFKIKETSGTNKNLKWHAPSLSLSLSQRHRLRQAQFKAPHRHRNQQRQKMCIKKDQINKFINWKQKQHKTNSCWSCQK